MLFNVHSLTITGFIGQTALHSPLERALQSIFTLMKAPHPQFILCEVLVRCSLPSSLSYKSTHVYSFNSRGGMGTSQGVVTHKTFSHICTTDEEDYYLIYPTNTKNHKSKLTNKRVFLGNSFSGPLHNSQLYSRVDLDNFRTGLEDFKLVLLRRAGQCVRFASVYPEY